VERRIRRGTEDTLSNVINPDDPNELDNNKQGATNHGGAGPPADLTITALTPDATAAAVDRCTFRGRN